MERPRSYSNRLSEVLSSKSQLFPDANAFRGRAYDHILSMSKMWPSMERKLGCFYTSVRVAKIYILAWVLIIISSSLFSPVTAYSSQSNTHRDEMIHSFTFVVFICVWRRPLLTRFVLDHFSTIADDLRPSGIRLDLFIVGSEENSTKEFAQRRSATYAVHPNHPVGRKHQLGLLSLRDHYQRQAAIGNEKRLPDAVVIFGSDDIVTVEYFKEARRVMTSDNGVPAVHVFGLRDVWFFDLRTWRLVYTPGYRQYETPLAGTVGCGRAFSWSLLQAIRWQVWDEDRDRGLDQSAVRNIMRRSSFASEVSSNILGRSYGVLAVDIKSDGFTKTGTNVWGFDAIVSAGNGTGRLESFREVRADITLKKTFGDNFFHRLEALRADMISAES